MLRSIHPSFVQRLALGLGVILLLFGGCEVVKTNPSPLAPACGPVSIQERIELDDLHPRSATFSFANVGTADLRIDSVSTSCGCTIAATPAQTIPPGQVATIRVLGKPPQVGKRRVQIVVETNLPVQPRLILTWDLIDESPPPRLLDLIESVHFGIHVVGDRIEPQSVQIEVLETASTPPIISFAREVGPFRLNGGFVGQRNVEAPGLVARSYRWNVSVEGLDVPGTVSGQIQAIRADDQAKPWFVIPITLTLVEPVRVVPDRLILPSSEPCSFRLLVASKLDDQDLTVTCESHDPHVSVTVARSQPGRIWFDVTVNHPGNVRELEPVVFSVTRPVAKRLSVPLTLPRTQSE